jgi:putative ABC transport system permease protein
VKLQDQLDLAWRSLVRHRLRTILTMLGMVIGVAAVVLLTSLGLGARDLVEQEIERLGTNLVSVQPIRRTGDGLSSSTTGRHELSESDAAALANEISAVEYAVPVVVGEVRLVSRDANWPTFVVGTHPDYLAARDWGTDAGRNFTMVEVAASARVALLGRTVADKISPSQSPVGAIVRINNVPFRVVGVLAEKGQVAGGQDHDDVVVAPISTVKSRLVGGYYREHRDAVGLVLIKSASASLQIDLREDIGNLLKHRHGLAPEDAADFRVGDPVAALSASRSASESLTWLLAAIASVSLLVGGISIMNIMLVSVAERSQEIGIRIVVGADRKDVLAQFLAEAAAVGLFGGTLGATIGASAALALESVLGWRMHVSPWVCLGALAFSALVGLASGFYPAFRASALDPMDAIRR